MDTKLIKAMVIGDGYLSVGATGKNAYFGCLHGIKQKEYLLWKREMLAKIGYETRYGERVLAPNRLVKRVNPICEIRGRTNEELTALHQLMYPRAERGFRPCVLKDLDESHLAIIFMDDGCRGLRSTPSVYKWKDRVYSYDYEPFIQHFHFCLENYTGAGIGQFCDWLKARFLIRAHPVKIRNQKRVAIYDRRSKKRLVELLKPHMHPSLAYKLEGNLGAHAKRLSEETSSEGDKPEGMMRQSALAGNKPQEESPKSLSRHLEIVSDGHRSNRTDPGSQGAQDRFDGAVPRGGQSAPWGADAHGHAQVHALHARSPQEQFQGNLELGVIVGKPMTRKSLLIDSDAEMQTRPKQTRHCVVQGERLSGETPFGAMQQSDLAGRIKPQEVGSKRLTPRFFRDGSNKRATRACRVLGTRAKGVLVNGSSSTEHP